MTYKLTVEGYSSMPKREPKGAAVGQDAGGILFDIASFVDTPGGALHFEMLQNGINGGSIDVEPGAIVFRSASGVVVGRTALRPEALPQVLVNAARGLADENPAPKLLASTLWRAVAVAAKEFPPLDSSVLDGR